MNALNITHTLESDVTVTRGDIELMSYGDRPDSVGLAR